MATIVLVGRDGTNTPVESGCANRLGDGTKDCLLAIAKLALVLAGEMGKLANFAQGARILTDAGEGTWGAVGGGGTVLGCVVSSRGEEAERGSGGGVGTGFGAIKTAGNSSCSRFDELPGRAVHVRCAAPIVTGGG